MLRPDFTQSALRPTAPTEQQLRPMPGASFVGGAGFGVAFREVQQEVAAFIDNGSGVSASAASAVAAVPALSAEGQLVRQASMRSASGDTGADPQAFLAAIGPAAEDAAQRLGVAPELVAAHAALESGWGRRPVPLADGRSSHNLFGIKAGASWQGDVAHALTTEVEQGVPSKKVEPFRSYPDQASAFRDYTRLLLENPRYSGALNTGSDAQAFAQGLVRGGYATDPAYADKLARVAARLQSRD